VFQLQVTKASSIAAGGAYVAVPPSDIAQRLPSHLADVPVYPQYLLAAGALIGVAANTAAASRHDFRPCREVARVLIVLRRPSEMNSERIWSAGAGLVNIKRLFYPLYFPGAP
jgi:hypothetical protein